MISPPISLSSFATLCCILLFVGSCRSQIELQDEFDDALLYTNPDPQSTIIILVGWNIKNPTTIHTDYTSAVFATFEVAESLFELIQSTIEPKLGCNNLNLSSFILVGHSLGAQTCGLVGYLFQSSPHHVDKLKMIGLDPPGLFDLVGGPQCLTLNSKSAGLLVEVIHTSSKLGTSIASGHVEYFINGGVEQKECLQ